MDAHPTGDQEVAGSTPAGSAILFRGDLIMKYFLRSFSLPPIQEGPLSVSNERMCTILVNLGKLTALDMTPFGLTGP